MVLSSFKHSIIQISHNLSKPFPIYGHLEYFQGFRSFCKQCCREHIFVEDKFLEVDQRMYAFFMLLTMSATVQLTEKQCTFQPVKVEGTLL